MSLCQSIDIHKSVNNRTTSLYTAYNIQLVDCVSGPSCKIRDCTTVYGMSILSILIRQ